MLLSRGMGVTSPQNLQRVLHAPLLLLQGCRWPPSAALALSHLQKGGLGPLSSQSLQVGQIMKHNVRHQTPPLEMRQQGVATILEKGKGSSSHPFSTAHPQLKVMSSRNSRAKVSVCWWWYLDVTLKAEGHAY